MATTSPLIEELGWRYPDKPTTGSVAFLKSIDESNYVALPKKDGWRAIVYVDGPTVEIYSRDGRLLESALKKPYDPHIRQSLAALNLRRTVLDGEFVGRRGGFQESLHLFDVTMLEGKWITNLSRIDRYQTLCHIAADALSPVSVLGPLIEGDFLRNFWRRTVNGLATDEEGIVLYRRGSTRIDSTVSSVDNPQWIKVKWREIAKWLVRPEDGKQWL